MRFIGLVLCWVMVTTSGVTAAVRRAPESEIVYVVDCGGDVDVIASATAKLVRRVDFAARLPIPRRPGGSHATAPDNCLLNGALYVSRQHAFYSLVADHYSEPQRFGIWRFTVPGLVAHEVQPPFAEADNLPVLRLAPDGSVKPQSVTEKSIGTDITGYAGAKSLTPTGDINRSGATVLVSLVAPGQSGLAFGVADTARRTLTLLQRVPRTTERFVHLTPGGGFVLVETTTNASAEAERTGTITLLNTTTGLPIRTLADTRIVGRAFFVAITPAGRALYRKGPSYISVDLGQRFGTSAVTTASGTAGYFVP